jgi:hypothetical protein
MVALLAVLSEHGDWLADFGDPFFEQLFRIWLECELLAGDDDEDESGSIASSDVVFWLYSHGALPVDHFAHVWGAHLTGDPASVVPDMAARLIAARIPGIERLLGPSLPLLRPSLEADQVLQYEDILGISFLITWSFPAELAALEDFSEIVNFIWDYFNSPEAHGGEDSDFYLLAGTVAALADAGALPVGRDELRGRALGWIRDADPKLTFAAILGGVFVLLVCCRNEPAQLAADFWVTEKLAGIVEAALHGAEGFAMIGIAFALLLAQFCPEQAGELASLVAGLFDWWKSHGRVGEQQSIYLNWIPPVVDDLLPEDLRSE